MTTLSLWTCPECGRQFVKRRRWHSCHARSVGEHLQDKGPELREILETLIARLQEFGQQRVDAVQTSINLIDRYHFGGIAVQKSALRLGFVLDEAIE